MTSLLTSPQCMEEDHEWSPSIVEQAADMQKGIHELSDDEYEVHNEQTDNCFDEPLSRQSPSSHHTDSDATVQSDANANDEYTLITMHGHKYYGIPDKFILHKAPEHVEVSEGIEIGEMLKSQSGKMWNINYKNVTIVGGKMLGSGEFKMSPYVCFKPKQFEESDDARWLRPIPAKVMEFWQPTWKEEIKEINELGAADSAPLDDTIDSCGISMVLNWKNETGKGQMDILQLGIGNGGLVPLEEKPKSIRKNPVPQKKNEKKQATSTPGAGSAKREAKPLSPICKKAEKKDVMHKVEEAMAENSGISWVQQARTVKIGPSAKTNTFEADGFLYATILG